MISWKPKPSKNLVRIMQGCHFGKWTNLECSHTLEPFHFYFVFVVEQFQILCECLTYRTVAHQHGLEGSLTVEDMFCRWKLPILWESVNNMGHSKYGLKLNFNAIIMRTMKSLLERDPRRKFAQWQIRRTRWVRRSLPFPRSGNLCRRPLPANNADVGRGMQASGVASSEPNRSCVSQEDGQ